MDSKDDKNLQNKSMSLIPYLPFFACQHSGCGAKPCTWLIRSIPILIDYDCAVFLSKVDGSIREIPTPPPPNKNNHKITNSAESGVNY